MIRKALVITSFAAGYVLGAKAGRERYLQIRSLFIRVKNDPHVREKVHEAVEFAHEHGSALTDKALHRNEASSEADLRPHSTTVGGSYAAQL